MSILNNKLELNAGETVAVIVTVDGRELDVFNVELSDGVLEIQAG